MGQETTLWPGKGTPQMGNVSPQNSSSFPKCTHPTGPDLVILIDVSSETSALHLFFVIVTGCKVRGPSVYFPDVTQNLREQQRFISFLVLAVSIHSG